MLENAKTLLRELNLPWKYSVIENLYVLCSTEIDNLATNHTITINVLHDQLIDHIDQVLYLSNQRSTKDQIRILAFCLEGRNGI